MSERVRIQLQPLGKTVEVARGTPLREVLFRHGVEFPCGGQGRCSGCRVKLVAGVLPPTSSDLSFLTAEEVGAGWRLACRAQACGDLALEIGQWEEFILADHRVFDFTPRPGLGIAIDLGTTTLVAQLLDLRTARVLAVQSAVNPQSAHGADVMSRVTHALSPEGREAMQGLIRSGLGSLVSELLNAAKAHPGDVDRVVVVGNTVMHHLFCGLDVSPLSQYPFVSEQLGGQQFRGHDLGWPVGGEVHFLPCIAGFVGSDILAGIYATRLYESAVPAAMLDLGTNAEIVVGDRQRLLCASAAAGPAFEGARIAMGMRAATGAIAEVDTEGGRYICRVLGGGPARGLCGSGLVDAVARGLELGHILPSGRLADGKKELELQPPVHLTQQDVRELQLAKGAIAAGLYLLAKHWNLPLGELGKLFIAGAFGNYVRHASAARIGLFDVPSDRIEAVGNTALLGAKMALFLPADELDFASLLCRVQHVPLAADQEFQDAFASAMTFP